MKKLISFFAVMLFCQMIWAQNEIITTIAPKTRLFPSSGLSYVDDPAKYFSIQMINTTGTSMDVFFTIDLSCDFSASNENYYLRTKKRCNPPPRCPWARCRCRSTERSSTRLSGG